MSPSRDSLLQNERWAGSGIAAYQGKWGGAARPQTRLPEHPQGPLPGPMKDFNMVRGALVKEQLNARTTVHAPGGEGDDRAHCLAGHVQHHAVAPRGGQHKVLAGEGAALLGRVHHAHLAVLLWPQAAPEVHEQTHTQQQQQHQWHQWHLCLMHWQKPAGVPGQRGTQRQQQQHASGYNLWEFDTSRHTDFYEPAC